MDIDLSRRGIESFSGRPKRTSAELNPQSLSGVFLSCNKALTTLSLLRLPLGPTLSSRILLVILTATSARQLDWGK